MYTDFFDFNSKPFELDPDLSFIYSGKANKESLATLIYAVEEREGWALVLGKPGTGKTTLILQLLKELGEKVWPAVITNPDLPMMDFLSLLSLELGFEKPIIDKSEFLIALRGLTSLCRKRGTNLLIVIDDAQHLSNGMLQELLLIHRQDAGKPRVLNLILLGTPELGFRLQDPSLLSIKQSLRRVSLLRPLTRHETYSYVRRRLEVAGGSPEIFTPEALEVIFRASGGVPRVINSTCDTALLLAMGRDTKEVDGELAEIAASGLRDRLAPSPEEAARPEPDEGPEPSPPDSTPESVPDQPEARPEPEPAPRGPEALDNGPFRQDRPPEGGPGKPAPTATALDRNIIPPPPMEKAGGSLARFAAIAVIILLLGGGYWLGQLYAPKVFGFEGKKATSIYIPPPIGEKETAGPPSGGPRQTGR